jgi:hypothetical protein
VYLNCCFIDKKKILMYSKNPIKTIIEIIMLEYKIEGDDYTLYNDNDLILRSSYKIAFAYSYWEEDGENHGVLHKHGSEDSVLKWHNNAYNKYKKSGLTDMANQMYMVCGRIPIKEVNKCIQISGYIVKLHEKILNNELKVQDGISPDLDEM